MYSKINAMALFGMEGVLIRVECDASSGLPEMSMVGFLGAEVREAKDRVRTALKNTKVIFWQKSKKSKEIIPQKGRGVLNQSSCITTPGIRLIKAVMDFTIL